MSQIIDAQRLGSIIAEVALATGVPFKYWERDVVTDRVRIFTATKNVIIGIDGIEFFLWVEGERPDEWLRSRLIQETNLIKPRQYVQPIVWTEYTPAKPGTLVSQVGDITLTATPTYQQSAAVPRPVDFSHSIQRREMTEKTFAAWCRDQRRDYPYKKPDWINEACSAEWSRQLREKVKASEEKERCQVVVDNSWWDD